MTTEEMIQHLESVLDTLRAKPVAMAPEPDPWPTAPLIVATWTCRSTGDGPVRATWANVDRGRYRTPEGQDFMEATNGCCTLANVVPVTVVAAAEWEALVEAMMRWDEGSFSPVTPTIRALLTATDALEVDL